MGVAPHMCRTAWPWWARFLCARILGHRDRNHADPRYHYAYCIRCGTLFGNAWSHPIQYLSAKQYAMAFPRGGPWPPKE